jgi:septal ring factor EnvC (AmiA/AmiB activator)
MEGFSIFLQTVIALGVIVYGFGQWRSGQSVKNSEDITSANGTIDLLKARADAFEAELKEAKKLHQSNHDEIIRLQEANKHKDKQIDEYLKIISNRNPELEKTLKDVRDFLQVLNTKLSNLPKIA